MTSKISSVNVISTTYTTEQMTSKISVRVTKKPHAVTYTTEQMTNKIYKAHIKAQIKIYLYY